MAVLLKPGPAVPAPGGPLAGAVVSSYQVDVLDPSGAYLGALQGVSPGGSVTWSSTSAVHGSGSLTVLDIGQGVDWLNVLLRPTLTTTSPDGVSAQYPLGVWIPAAPTETWTDAGRSWAISLTDTLGYLDRQMATGPNGAPITYGVASGANVIDAVVQLIQDAGLSATGIVPGSEALTTAMAWPVGTTRLKVINDLLSAAGYFSLRADRAGLYRADPWVQPSQRTPVYASVNPFTDGESSLMAPDFTRDANIYDVPNRAFGFTTGNGTSAGLSSVQVNVNPNSPYSYAARGNKWFDLVNTNLQATSQAALDSQTLSLLSQATSVVSTFNVSHLFLPALGMNQAANIQTSANYGGFEMLCYCTQLTVPLDPSKLCTSTLVEAVI